MANSPRTPGGSSHGRQPPNLDLSFATPLSYNGSPIRIQSPSTPGHRASDSGGNDLFGSSGGRAPSNGLGNLADELADEMWDEDGEDGEYEEPDVNFQEGGADREVSREIEVNAPRSPKAATNMLSPLQSKGHKRTPSEYDGSDYGGSDDMDSNAGIPPGLMARMDMVEALVRRGTDSPGTERDHVVKRVIESLRDLGAQGGVEGGATRLVTAHSALSTHILHQTRLLQSLAYPILSPLALPPDDEFIDDLMPLLLTIGDSMPRPSTAAFNSLNQLHTLTADLVQTLNMLSDTLHVSRQTTTAASRRLKTARDLVAELRREDEDREEGERFLTQGNWGERLRNRECAGVCGEVVGGFEEVCNGWRARLLAQAETVA